MADWGPVVIATILFVLLTPGLLFQLPGKGRVVEFNSMQTSGASIFVHTVIYFALVTIFLIAIGVHIYTGVVVRQKNGDVGWAKATSNEAEYRALTKGLKCAVDDGFDDVRGDSELVTKQKYISEADAEANQDGEIKED
ncbi:hypothetical protein Q3G72_023885 [Acer saccharum]|nr:hypothetical protein Q3G72_023885 [Acer saccharum]